MPIELTAEMRSSIERVHQSIVSRFTYVTDLQNFGVPDYWSLPREVKGRLFDDCDGFAIECRKELLEIGIDNIDLLLACCATEKCDPTLLYDHCILIIVATEGYAAIDIRQPDFVSCAELVARGYRRLMIVQKPGRPLTDKWDMMLV